MPYRPACLYHAAAGMGSPPCSQPIRLLFPDLGMVVYLVSPLIVRPETRITYGARARRISRHRTLCDLSAIPLRASLGDVGIPRVRVRRVGLPRHNRARRI